MIKLINKIVTFGEIMLRLKSPSYERLLQSPVFEATFGGGEANVAVSLANYGFEVSYITLIPDNVIGDKCIGELRKHGVDASLIKRGPGRMGIYFLENGSNQRPSKVIYDRENSSISKIKKDSFDWQNIFKTCSWFHLSGITPAISQSAASASLNAVKIAKELGVSISCDLNYRAKLWKYGKSAKEIMSEIVNYVDVVIANEEDCQQSLGIGNKSELKKGHLEIDVYKKLSETIVKVYPNIRIIAITLRESKSANHNNWAACLYDGRKFLISHKYSINNIVDRVGAGDSFAAGLIYGLNNYPDNKKALEFAVAASCLKHTIPGDFNRVSIDEVENVMTGDSSGRIQR